MSKQARRRDTAPTTTENYLPEKVPAASEAKSARIRSLAEMPSLASIRTAVLEARADAEHTIGELETWAAEIHATIAFLKSQRP